MAKVASKSMDIRVDYVTRVEGHGNIVAKVEDGELVECRMEITESPRFFEAMLRGRSWKDAMFLVTRICGICACGHGSASLKATEDAMGITRSEQTERLRRIVLHAEQLESHWLHCYFLVAPDFLGAPSVIPLAKTHTDVVLRAMRLKKLSHHICGVLVGRHTHPIGMVPGGYMKLPSVRDLRELRDHIASFEADVRATVDLFATLEAPAFERETEYESITRPDEYAFFDGRLITSDGDEAEAHDYGHIIHESIVEHSSAKHVRNRRESLMVGALARFNNNHTQLLPQAKDAADRLGLAAPCTNPFHNNTAQIVESVHCYYEVLRLLDELIEAGIQDEKPPLEWPRGRAGTGVGIVEVPRGTLVHEYEYDADGIVTGANLVIPTNQNLANIEADFRAYVPQLMDEGRSEAEVTHALERLVRAYDPCISCSTHLVQVEFK
ncbi:MAG: hydrogenase/sulfur reductase subunit alpha [Planctomycetes bacterium SM23_25]|nr:MAG: hydrogenase/sulfur reductase subunit alpha [Planctomycetes bacterium SM23_25]